MVAGTDGHPYDAQVPCAVSSAALGTIQRIAWRKLIPKKGADGAQDVLARAAQHVQAHVAASRAFCRATSAPDMVLELLQATSLYSLESKAQYGVLWLFDLPEGASLAPDAALDGLEGTHTRAYAVHEAGEYALQRAAHTSAHSQFLQAVQAVLADAYVESTAAEHEQGVRCSAGVLLLRSACLVRFAAHTTHTVLVARMHAERMPWMPLSIDYDPGDAPTARPGETPLLLLPTLAPATFLGAVSDTSCASTIRLADALQAPMTQAQADDTAYCCVRVSIQAPPSALPADALDMGLERGIGTVSTTIQWPAALCLHPVTKHGADPKLVPLREQSVAALLEAARDTPLEPAAGNAAPPKALGSNVYAPPLAHDLDDDVFQGIGQLTEDDFRFFDGPSGAPPLEAPPVQGPGAPLNEPLSEAPSAAKTPSSPHALLPPPLPAITCSSPPFPCSASDSPERASRRAKKYEMHGKFYTPSSVRGRKRAHSFEVEERRTALRMSPRATTTPQSVAPSSSSPHASSSLSSKSSDEPEAPFVARAALLARLHTSTWAPPMEHGAVPPPGPTSERAWLAYAALGHAPKLDTPRHVPPAWNALETWYPARPLALPRVLVGCQRAILELDTHALDVWPTLGLEPADGPKRMHVAAVLVGDVDVTAVRQWLEGLQRVYARLRLGVLSPGEVFVLRQAQLVRPTGQPAVLVDAFQAASPADARAVLVLHAPDAQREAEHGYEMWHHTYTVLPVPRAAIQPASVQDLTRLAGQARTLYDAAPRAHSPVRPAVALAPSHYAACRVLRPGCKLALVPNDGPRDVLQHGAVLHVAYDVVLRAQGACIRVVGIDDRAQRTFLQTWSSDGPHADVPRLWDTIAAHMQDAIGVAWNVVVCRYGAIPRDEVHAWAALEHNGLRSHRGVLDVVLLSVELGAPLPASCAIAGPYAVLAPESMLIAQDPLVLSMRTAYVGDGTRDTAWTVHLVRVAPAPEASAQRATPETYLADVVVHLGALQHVTTLRWPAPCVSLPWHVAVLVQSSAVSH